MIKDTYKQILKGQDVRKNLIELRKDLKESYNKHTFVSCLAGDYSKLYELLESEDAKIRKNIALIMGELGEAEFMDKLYAAYEEEDKLFVKSDYLTAIANFDYRPLLENFKERLEFLTNNTFEEASQKHIRGEVKALTDMILMLEPPSKHEFTGYTALSDIILLTNRDYQQITLDQIKEGQAKVFNAGVIVRTNALHEILKIRTYVDLFFRLQGALTVENNPEKAAQSIYDAGLLDFLKVRHQGEMPYYFRIEIKSKMPLDKKSVFAKKMAAVLEKATGRKLINSTSNYEFEIRLIENKEGVFNVLLKLYTIADCRFQYRKNTIATSIAPSHAALVATLTKDYLKENAQVLDPFCGVGTMLIERQKVVPTKVMYGIDIFGGAIDGAIENAILDETDIYFVNRDFFDFQHRYRFDEIFTNMPTCIGRKTQEEINEIYDRFFDKALEILADEAIIVMYTRDSLLVEKGVNRRKEYTIIKTYEISRKEEAYVYILSKSTSCK